MAGVFVTPQLGFQTLKERRRNSRLNTVMKVLVYEHLHPVFIDYFNNLNTFSDSCQTQNSTRCAPKAQTISKDQFLYSFMPRTMRDLRE